MKNVLIICAFLLTIPLLAACQNPAPPAAEEKVNEESANEEQGTFSQIDTFDIYGNPVEGGFFADYQLTMVNIWATYCQPCIIEMPYLGEMALNMPPNTRLIGVVIDVIDDDYLALAGAIAEDTGANYTHLLMDEVLYNYISQNVTGVPTTIFIDKNGEIVGSQLVGVRSRQDYEEELALRLEQLSGENL